ncbi:hypothetical protein [Cohnella kolymensis]|nr:hypothetical protein [Cohnella kolymensis]
MMMWIVRICVFVYFLYIFEQFSQLITMYNIHVKTAQSAVQASQLANESILLALTYIGKLLVVVAGIMVFESMYRNSRRAALRERLNQTSESNL